MVLLNIYTWNMEPTGAMALSQSSGDLWCLLVKFLAVFCLFLEQQAQEEAQNLS